MANAADACSNPNESCVYALTSLEGNDALHATDEGAQHQQHNHDDAHQVEQVYVFIYQHIIRYLAYIYRYGQSQNTIYQCSKEGLMHHALVGSKQLQESHCYACFLIARLKAFAGLQQDKNVGPHLFKLGPCYLMHLAITWIHIGYTLRANLVDDYKMAQHILYHHQCDGREWYGGQGIVRSLYTLGG